MKTATASRATLPTRLWDCSQEDHRLIPSDRRRIKTLLAALRRAEAAADDWLEGHDRDSCQCLSCVDVRTVRNVIGIYRSNLESTVPGSIVNEIEAELP